MGRYDLSEEVALQCPEVQDFATDPAMALIARNYLGTNEFIFEVCVDSSACNRRSAFVSYGPCTSFIFPCCKVSFKTKKFITFFYHFIDRKSVV